MKELVYVAAVTKEADGGFSVMFPDVPGAISEGETVQEAVENAREALELIIEAHVENNQTIPSAPKPIWETTRKVLKGGRMPYIVVASAPSKAVRINITMDEGLLDRLDRAAEGAGKSRSSLIAEAVRSTLRA
ncbi:MAG: type II toxin-antitoxin system HicB family antitoxin [Alphaproteobacteria bacterium]